MKRTTNTKVETINSTEIFFYKVTCNTIAAIIGRYHCKPVSELANIIQCNKSDVENGSFLRFEIFKFLNF